MKLASTVAGGVFRVSLQGTLTTLANFSPLSWNADYYPIPALCLDTDGSLLGVTALGGQGRQGDGCFAWVTGAA